MQLRDYQIEIAEKTAKLIWKYKIAYMAMQTRTGKTLTALKSCDILKANKVLFITKKKAIPSILSDYANTGYEYHLDCVNYESLHKVKGLYDVIIADEAHSLGAFPKPSKRTQMLKKLVGIKPIIFLSATPSPESYAQLYHQFAVSNHSPFAKYSNFYQWAGDYVKKEKMYAYGREFWDYSNANKNMIAAETKHLFISYTQKDAGFNVVIDEKILRSPMSALVRKMIQGINKDRIYIDDNYEIVADTAVKVMQKTHQLCGGTVIDEAGYNIISTSKAKYIQKVFERKDIAIFYMYKSEAEILKSVFPNWTDQYEEFQKNGGVFLGQFRSAREGIRLDRAEAIIFYNIDFSYLSYEQARNRIASLERTDKAVLYWVFTVDGIEEKIYNVVKGKEDYTLYHYKNDRVAVRTEMEQEGSQQRLDFR